MKVYEASKSKKMSTKEFLEVYGEEYNLKSHLSKIPAELEEELFGQEKKIETPKPEPTETVDSAETVVVEDIDLVEEVLAEIEGKEVHKPIVKDEKVPSLEEIELGIRGCGSKSSMWKWRHLLDE